MFSGVIIMLSIKSKDVGLMLLRTLPRVSLKNIRDNPKAKKKVFAQGCVRENA